MDLSIKANRDRSPLIDINPSGVRLTARRRPGLWKLILPLEHRGLAWPLKRGIWDFFTERFAAHPTFREIETLLGVDLDYERLPAFKKAVSSLRKGKSIRSSELRRNRLFRSENELRGHYDGVVSLIQSVQRDGYRLDDGAIGLGIGRDGRLIKQKHGHHRLAVAQLLGVPRVRFRVLAIHPKWFLRHFADDPERLSERLPEAIGAIRE